MIDFQNNGDGTSTVTIQYTHESVKIQKALELCAKRLWAGGNDSKEELDEIGIVISRILWDDLTTQEKIAELDVGLREIILNLARRQYREDLAKVAVESSEDGTVEI